MSSRTPGARQRGSATVEFVIVIPVLFLLIWGGVVIGIQLLDGMLLGYGVYEEARREAVSTSDEDGTAMLVHAVMAWSKFDISSLIRLQANRKVDGKDVIVETSFLRPWGRPLSLTNPIEQFLPGSWTFSKGLRALEQATETVQFSYSLPRENKGMYNTSIWEIIWEILPIIAAILGISILL